jgi:hypothetical protein
LNSEEDVLSLFSEMVLKGGKKRLGKSLAESISNVIFKDKY